MNRNIKIAMELVRIARELVASQENFGSYSIDFDKEKRTFTVYFILKEDAVESKAMRNAQSCRYETKMAFSGDERISVTYLENNQKSFSFNIVVDEDDKVASGEDDVQFRFAVDGDAESDERDNSDTSQQKGHGSEKKKDDAGDKDSEQDEADSGLFEEIEETVSRICEKHKWSVKK